MNGHVLAPQATRMVCSNTTPPAHTLALIFVHTTPHAHTVRRLTRVSARVYADATVLCMCAN